MIIDLSPADDYRAMIANAPAWSQVRLLPGIYTIPTPIRPPDFVTISGSGPSTILLNQHDGPVIENAMTSYGKVMVEDLVVDCNGLSFLGVNLYGSHNTVRRIAVRRHTNPSAAQESFGILLHNSTDGNGWRACSGNLVEDCEILDFAGFYNGGITIACQRGLAPMDGIIRRCSFIQTATPPAEVGPGVGVFGASLVEDCLIWGVATGVYTEGLNCRSTPAMTVRRCRFLNIRSNAVRINLIKPQPDMLVEDCWFGMALPHGIAIEAYANALQLFRITVRNNTLTGDLCRMFRAPGILHKTVGGNVDLSR